MHRESGDPADPITAAERAALDRVRRELAALGTDTGSAQHVPADVTTAIEAALRDAPPVPHRVVAPRTRPRGHTGRPLRWRRTAAAVGLVTAVLAFGIAVFALGGTDGTEPSFAREPGPSARHLTARPPFPLTGPQILHLLRRPADLGALGEPQRCLKRLGYPAGTSILGAQPVVLGRRPATLLVLPAQEPSSVVAIVVGPDCPTAGTAALARTELARP